MIAGFENCPYKIWPTLSISAIIANSDLLNVFGCFSCVTLVSLYPQAEGSVFCTPNRFKIRVINCECTIARTLHNLQLIPLTCQVLATTVTIRGVVCASLRKHDREGTFVHRSCDHVSTFKPEWPLSPLNWLEKCPQTVVLTNFERCCFSRRRFRNLVLGLLLSTAVHTRFHWCFQHPWLTCVWRHSTSNVLTMTYGFE